jgi:hypothetical protein
MNGWISTGPFECPLKTPNRKEESRETGLE